MFNHMLHRVSIVASCFTFEYVTTFVRPRVCVCVMWFVWLDAARLVRPK